MKQFCSAALAMLPLLALAACGGGGGGGGDSDSTTGGPAIYCPQVAVLAQANTLTQYLPGHTDIGAQITTATITGIAGACSLDEKSQILTVSFKAGFAATNGPANHGQTVTLPYFVALTHGDNIIQKTSYTIDVTFDGNTSTATATSKTLRALFPNEPASTGDEVLIGFQEPQP